MRYRLVCFDAGFTLIMPRRTTAATLAAVLADEGIKPTEDALQRAWDVADRWFWDEYHRPDNQTWLSDELIRGTWRQHHRLMLNELGVEDSGYRLTDAVVASYSQPENWQVYPDVFPTLDLLRQHELTLGIVSDWGSRLPQLIEALGLARYFAFVLASATAGAAKPVARFYQTALQKAGVPTQAAVMVGDSYRADVEGARAAGMDAVLLDRNGTSDVRDVPVIRSLEELPALLEATP